MINVRTSSPKSAGIVNNRRYRTKRVIVPLERASRLASNRQRHNAEIGTGSDRCEPEAAQTVGQAAQLDRILDPDIGGIRHDKAERICSKSRPTALISHAP